MIFKWRCLGNGFFNNPVDCVKRIVRLWCFENSNTDSYRYDLPCAHSYIQLMRSSFRASVNGVNPIISRIIGLFHSNCWKLFLLQLWSSLWVTLWNQRSLKYNQIDIKSPFAMLQIQVDTRFASISICSTNLHFCSVNFRWIHVMPITGFITSIKAAQL